MPRVNLCKELNASYQRRVTLVKRCQIVEQKECNTCNEMSIRTKEAIHLHRQFVIAYLDTETGTAIYRVKLCCGNFLVTHGQWWWSSGQHSRLLLWRSEFESRWSLQFLFCKLFEKNENKQKEAGDGPFL